jgi:hypothetical protein
MGLNGIFFFYKFANLVKSAIDKATWKKKLNLKSESLTYKS